MLKKVMKFALNISDVPSRIFHLFDSEGKISRKTINLQGVIGYYLSEYLSGVYNNSSDEKLYLRKKSVKGRIDDIEDQVI